MPAQPTDKSPPSADDRVLFATYPCYLDDSNGAAVASRSLLETLVGRGFAVESVSSSWLQRGGEVDTDTWLSYHGSFSPSGAGVTLSLDTRGIEQTGMQCDRGLVNGVPVTIYRCLGRPGVEPDDIDRENFLKVFSSALERFRPRCLVTYGGDRVDDEIRSLARARGVVVIFALHSFGYSTRSAFADVDAVLVPSRFAAAHFQRMLDLQSVVIPNLVDFDRIKVESRQPKYLTFVNPSLEKGVFAFARIADELGRRRPDIPLLVVESRGTESTLVDCGIDLREHKNVSIMSHTPDPRHFWRLTRVLLMPSLWWENQPLVAIEAMANGVPVVASDRGGIPEVLGNSGVILPLPERLTPYSGVLPTPGEVVPWINAIAEIWDNPALLAEHAARGLVEASRWDRELIAAQATRFFRSVTQSRTGSPFAEEPRSRVPLESDSPWALRATSWDQIAGMFDFASLYDSAVEAAPDGAIFVEIGCLIGRSTSYLATKIRDSGKAITLYAIDTARGSASDSTGQEIVPSVGGSLAGILHRNLIGCGVDHLVVPILTTSIQAASLFGAGTIDFCFIDADHSYDSVLADLRTWWPKVKQGGILAGHDYRQTSSWLLGVTEAVDEFFGGRNVAHPICTSSWSVIKTTSHPAL